MADDYNSTFPPASPYPDAAAAAAASASSYEPIPLPYGLDSIAPSSMSALTAEKLEKFRVGSQAKSRFQIEKEEKEGAAPPVRASIASHANICSAEEERRGGGGASYSTRRSRLYGRR